LQELPHEFLFVAGNAWQSHACRGISRAMLLSSMMPAMPPVGITISRNSSVGHAVCAAERFDAPSSSRQRVTFERSVPQGVTATPVDEVQHAEEQQRHEEIIFGGP